MTKARWLSAGGIKLLGRGFLCGAAFAGLMLGLTPAGTAETKQPPALPGCGVDEPCRVPDGEYRVRMPKGWDGSSRVGAILFLHGYGGTAEHEINNKRLIAAASELDLALIAPQGQERSWSFPGPYRQQRDDLAFIRSVLDDTVARHSVDPDRIMASGFSVGGSMVWYLACYMGDRFAGFAPVAGAFWEPLPQDCPGPEPNLFHVHGTHDTVVPMAGRVIRDVGRQGDVRKGFALWEAKGACTDEAPVEFAPEGLELACERRTECAGKTIELCLHSGGHVFKTAWVRRAWQELAAIKGWKVPAHVE